MELTHSFTVPASVEATWRTFRDLKEVGQCFPGATVTEVTDDGFSGTVKVTLGPISLMYAGSGTFVERDDAAHRAVIEAKGKDQRGNGTADASVTIQLSGDDGSTRADLHTDLSVTGKPAQFGRGVMQDVSDKLLQRFVDCIEARISSPVAAGEPAAQAQAMPGEAVPVAPAEPLAADEPAGAAARSGGEAAPQDALVDAEIPLDRTAPAPAPTARTPAAGSEAIDLGSTRLPVLVKSYGKPAALGLAVVLLVMWLVRRSRR